MNKPPNSLLEKQPWGPSEEPPEESTKRVVKGLKALGQKPRANESAKHDKEAQ